MLGQRDRKQPELFVAGSLRELIPDDHILARVDKVLDLSWLTDEVAECYSDRTGRPGIDPEVAIRLMLAGFLLGFVHDRRLMREAQVNLAIRWFIGYGLHEALPDHSSLTRIRQRWGAARFRRVFQRSVRACLDAKIATGEVVHVDATLVRANVSWEALAERHIEAVEAENASEEDRHSRDTGKFKKICTTDPDATMATSSRKQRLEPSYKQHTVVDDQTGVVLDVTVTTGEINEGDVVAAQLDEVAATTGVTVATMTADAGYAYGKVFGAMEARCIDAVIPTKREPAPRGVIPLRRFRYDAKHNLVRCPRGRKLRPGWRTKHGWYYRASRKDCNRCPLRQACISPKVDRRVVVISDDYAALLRARRRRHRWSRHEWGLYTRHRWQVEGVHGEAKTQHGLARAVRRGLANMAIQAYLAAMAINLKRLAAALLLFLTWLCAVARTGRSSIRLEPSPS
jgi:transposase